MPICVRSDCEHKGAKQSASAFYQRRDGATNNVCRSCTNRIKRERYRHLVDGTVPPPRPPRHPAPIPDEPIEGEDTDPRGPSVESVRHFIEHKDEIALLKKQNKELLQELQLGEKRLRVLDSLQESVDRTVMTYGSPGGMREATAVLVCSDWHVEEPVEAEKVSGLNEYTLAVAKRRIRRLAEGLLWKVDVLRSGYQIDTLMLALLGDLLSGYIHEELEETAQLSPVETVLWLEAELRTFIESIAEHGKFKRILVPCVVGNHGRTTKKRRISTNAENSFEFLLFKHLQSVFENHPTVAFDVPKSKVIYHKVYDTVVRSTHGDAIRGGSNIGGITIPINKWIMKTDISQQADITQLGHFHQYISTQSVVVNSSLIGYNTFAQEIGAAYEPPQQAMYLIDSLHGKVESAPIWVEGD